MSYFVDDYLRETRRILKVLDHVDIESMACMLSDVRASSNRLFIIGNGGSAATASHAVNDLRKIVKIEAYAPTDNVAELTARTNDDGWESTFARWLNVSKLGLDDALLVLSVGGGSTEASPNIVQAVSLANDVGAIVLGIVGRDGGFVRKNSDVCLVIPPLYEDRITPHTEGITSIILHLLVSHPVLRP
jgi:D-sedoheptulose 7-phosphate isomerase